MRKISQGVATKIAEDMVAKTIGKKIAEVEKEVRDEEECIKNLSIPSDILEFHKKYPNLCYCSSYIQLVCDTLVLERAVVNRFPTAGGNKKLIEISREQYDWFFNQSELLKSLKEEKEKLQNQIYETLLHLSTPKRIQSDFPEAYELLEVYIKKEENEKCAVIALPIDEIKNSLLKYKD